MISAVKISVLICCFGLIYRGETADFPWSYHGDNDGPNHWARNYPNCGGHFQTPILIDTELATHTTVLGQFTFNGYDVQRSGDKIENDGHGVKVTVPGGITVSGGGLPDTYTLLQYHFHWGSDNHQGSEHVINGKYYPMEVHLVHQAVNSSGIIPDNQLLAVLGVFFEVVEQENTALKPIFDMIGVDIKDNGSSANLTSPFSVNNLLPTDRSSFYRYAGSLTTPPCSEAVVWTIFKDPIKISGDQMKRFQERLTAYGHALNNNYRPLQILGERTVHRTFDNVARPETCDTNKIVSSPATVMVFGLGFILSWMK